MRTDTLKTGHQQHLTSQQVFTEAMVREQDLKTGHQQHLT